MVLLRKLGKIRNKSKTWNIVHEEGREVIQRWKDKRLHLRRVHKSYRLFLEYSFSFDTLKTFMENVNIMVIFQIFMAIMSVYISQKWNISFDIPVSLFVSPIVFPLAFSINTDFQRREKVLEDLAVFKSSGMIWYLCMREWKEAAGLDGDWITAVRGKLKSFLFHLQEYLFTYETDRRNVILRVMYEDFSDANQLIEKVRSSKLPSNSAIVSRSVHLLNMMCLSFERLRVIREYRSPRSIRSFTKVFIMVLPIILAPYFNYQSIKSNNTWAPYFVAVLISFIFSALQVVQDKLDDPFDGMSQDDINLAAIDEWTYGSLECSIKRSFKIDRLEVTPDSNFNRDEIQYTSSREDIGMVNNVLGECLPGSQRFPIVNANNNDCNILKDECADCQNLSQHANNKVLDTIVEPISSTSIDDIRGQSHKKGKTMSLHNDDSVSSDLEKVNLVAYSDGVTNVLSDISTGVKSLECVAGEEDFKYPSADKENSRHCDYSSIVYDNKNNISNTRVDKNHASHKIKPRGIRYHNSVGSRERFRINHLEKTTHNSQNNREEIDNKRDFIETDALDDRSNESESINSETRQTMKESQDDNGIAKEEKWFRVDAVNNVLSVKKKPSKYASSISVFETRDSFSHLSEEFYNPSIAFVDNVNNDNNYFRLPSREERNPTRHVYDDSHDNQQKALTNNKRQFGLLAKFRDTLNSYSSYIKESDCGNDISEEEKVAFIF